ncbi:MAG: MFS transporter [Acidobacteriota bacterium]
MDGISTAPEHTMQSSYKWCVIAMLWFACFLNYADRQAIFVLFPLLRVHFHLSDMQLALLGSSFMWTYAGFGLVTGWLGDWCSRKMLILAGLLFWLGITGATIITHKYWQLSLLRALSGMSEAIYFPAAMSMISDYHGPSTRSRAMALHQSAVYAGTVGGGVLASLLGERFGWRSSFIGLGALGLSVFFVLFLFLKEPQRNRSIPERSGASRHSARIAVRDILADTLAAPLVLRLIVAFIGANFVAMIFMVWLPSFLFRKFHMSLSMAGFNATIYLQVASVAGVLFGGVLADMLARRDRGGRMKTQAFGLLAGVAFLFLTGWAPSLQLLVAGMIGFGFSKGIYDSNIWASLHDVVPPERRAVAVGIMNSLGWIGGGVAPLAVAAGSRRFGMGDCLSATSLVYVVVAAILLWNARHAIRETSHRAQTKLPT